MASVVVASVNSAREKGRIGAGKQFETQIDHVAGELLAGKWDFDECPAAGIAVSALDFSGNGNNGALTGSPLWSSNTPTNRGCSMSLDGATQYIDITGSSSDSSLLNITGSSVTISAWIYISLATSSGTRYVAVKSMGGSLWSTKQYGIMLTGVANGLVCAINSGTSFSTSVGFGTMGTGQWHHVACTYDGSLVSHYVNGQLVSIRAQTGNVINKVANFMIGAATGGTSAFNGSIDNVRIYSKSLAASEIGRLYAEGLKTHTFAEK